MLHHYCIFYACEYCLFTFRVYCCFNVIIALQIEKCFKCRHLCLTWFLIKYDSSSRDVVSLATASVPAERQFVWFSGSRGDSYIRLPCSVLAFELQVTMSLWNADRVRRSRVFALRHFSLQNQHGLTRSAHCSPVCVIVRRVWSICAFDQMRNAERLHNLNSHKNLWNWTKPTETSRISVVRDVADRFWGWQQLTNYRDPGKKLGLWVGTFLKSKYFFENYAK